MTWLLRLLLLVMAFYLIQKVVAWVFGGWFKSTRSQGAASAPTGTKAIKGQMVKDPHCGMYVASSLALFLETEEQKVYFCSEDCRDAYVKQRELEASSDT
jgi:YHS domain-containing protein